MVAGIASGCWDTDELLVPLCPLDARRTSPTSVTPMELVVLIVDAVVARVRLVDDDVQDTQVVSELPGLPLVDGDEGRVDRDLIVQSLRQCLPGTLDEL